MRMIIIASLILVMSSGCTDNDGQQSGVVEQDCQSNAREKIASAVKEFYSGHKVVHKLGGVRDSVLALTNLEERSRVAREFADSVSAVDFRKIGLQQSYEISAREYYWMIVFSNDTLLRIGYDEDYRVECVLKQLRTFKSVCSKGWWLHFGDVELDSLRIDECFKVLESDFDVYMTDFKKHLLRDIFDSLSELSKEELSIGIQELSVDCVGGSEQQIKKLFCAGEKVEVAFVSCRRGRCSSCRLIS